jgi:outer membrane protein
MAVPFPAGRRFLLSVAALLALPAAAAAQKIAVIDFQLVFDQYEATEDAQRTLDRQLKDWDEEAKAMRDSIDALEAEIESQRLMLSEQRLQEKSDEVRRRKDEYQTFAESVWGVNGQAVRRNEELTKPIAERILQVVARIGDERNLDMVLDAGTGGVVWAKDDVNITQFVLDDLALTVQEQEGAPPAGGEGGGSGGAGE